MSSLSTTAAESSQCYQMVTSGPTKIAMSGGLLQIEWSNRSPPKEARADKIASVSTGRSWFWDTLSIRLVNGEEYSIGGLATGVAVRLRDALLADAETIKAEVAAAQSRARTIGDELKQVENEVARLFSGDNYIRHSESLFLHDQLTTVIQKCTEFVREHLIPEALSAFQRLERFRTLEAFETERNRVNDAFIQNSIPTVKSAAKSAFDITLTDEQAVAIATDEEATLVLAGAGTGKTAVITGKVAHLVRNEGVVPEEILVLAFNRTAAQEIRGRLPKDLKGAHVSTFHSFGYSVIGRGGIKPPISKLARDEQLLGQVVHNVLNEILAVSDQSEEIQDFIAYHRVQYRSPFEFENQGEYYEYVRDCEPRALSGDLVKSLEEVEVANFFTLNGIEFVYEGNYRVDTATSDYRQYQPDFYLPEYDIYVEHFALNEDGNPPPDWSRYRDGVDWKRDIHARYGTRLIETYSWQSKQGILRHELQRRLAEHGVTFRKVSFVDALKPLFRWVISWLAQLLTKFLHHVKTNGLTRDQLRQRALDSSNPIRSRSFLRVFEKLSDKYEAILKAEEEIDFHDLINDAETLLRSGRVCSPFRYILVDEFQDIAAGRMRLLQALDSPITAFFLVGDDWQSINRFAGSDINLFKNCEEYLGHVQERELSQTFRYGKGILVPSVDFVCKNPVQTQRTMRPLADVVDNGISIVAHEDEKQGMEVALRDIELKNSDDDQNARKVLVLGRYGFNNPGLTPSWTQNGNLHLRYSTIHGAKGQEADYVIVLGLKSGRYGFPSKIEDDPLLQLVMPSKVYGEMEHAEERRLFYVAMTRARRGSYLITDERQPSEFVTEIRKHHPGVRQIGNLASEQFPNCPKCSIGQLVPSESTKNLRCSNHPMCRFLAPRCHRCSVGYLAARKQSNLYSCTMSDCDTRSAICPSCRVGVLQNRDGKFGKFWGCSEYWSDPPCRHTEPVRPDRSQSRSGAPRKDAVRLRAARSRRFIKR